ncbi:MAG: putative protein N(5)-glutamine methyltransferase [Actinobacteria bacterium]|nr:putative protein N(5)-glutamine methyltransferase [Actinomycetota bacterium]
MPDPSPVVARLRAAGCVYAEEEAALLVASAAGPEELERLVLARIGGAPLEVLLGWAEVDGLRVQVAEGVFVPRQRSLLLARLAIAALGEGGVAVDLCCGTGVLGALVARAVPAAEVWAGDIDPAAVACARRNLVPERVVLGDLYDALPDALRGRVDVLVVNAPYVPTEAIALMPPEARLHEARVALDGGADGLDVQRRVIEQAGRWLSPSGLLLVESSVEQAPRTRALMIGAGLDAWAHHDDDLDATAVAGRPPTA